MFLLIALLRLAAATSAPLSAIPAETGRVALATDAEARWVAFDLTPGNQIRFTITVDGKPLVAILDTGVSYSVFSANSAGLDKAKVRSSGSASAIGGAVAIGWVPTGRITLGGLTRTGGGVTVAALPAIATGSATSVDMLVGRDLIGGHALDIDYAAHRFRILASGRLPFRGAIAPLTISRSRLVYESEIMLGDTKLRPMVVDTGDGSSITVTAAGWKQAASPGIPTTTTISYGLAGPAESELAIVPQLRAGQLVAKSVEVRIEPANGFSQSIGTAGRIGSGFLQNYRVLLDPLARRMVLSPGPNADKPPLRSTSGLLVGITPDRLRVLHVMRGGPAALGGWKANEEICAIDGTKIDPGYITSPLANWSIGAPGRVVAFTLCGGAIRSLTLRDFY